MQSSKKPDAKTPRKRPPATTIEARQNQLIAKAVDLAERQLDEGTASSQVMTHFLKLASTEKQLELKKLEHEVELVKAKTESIRSGQRVEEMYKNALDAMRTYTGSGRSDEDD